MYSVDYTQVEILIQVRKTIAIKYPQFIVSIPFGRCARLSQMLRQECQLSMQVLKVYTHQTKTPKPNKWKTTAHQKKKKSTLFRISFFLTF